MWVGFSANAVTHLFSESSRSHFNSPIGCYHFEDVAAVEGNRRIECGRYSASVFGKTKGRRISKYPDILHKNILSFLTSPVLDDKLREYRPRSA